jgi:hypothetical protein
MFAAGLLLAACSNANSPFRKPLTAPSTPAPAPANVAAQPVQSKVPYVLSAQCAGPFVNFSVYNMGTTELEVKKDDFAILSPDSRQVTPYDKANSIIDLPQPAIVKPNGTLQGRIIFKQINSPMGKRLVYKPDEIGTFADISAAPVGGAAAPAPAAM